MTNEIRIDDLAAPVLTDIQQMGDRLRRVAAAPSSPSTPCAPPRSPGPGSTTSAPTTSASASACSSPRWTPTRSAPGSVACSCSATACATREPAADPRPARRATPRSSTSRSTKPVIVVGLPRSGTTQPREPARGRHPVPVDAAVGVLRAGARTRTSRPPSTASTRAGPAASRRGRRCRRPRRSSPRCTRWSPTTSTRRSSSMAPDFSNYNHEWVGAGAAVARLLPRPRPDAALRVHEDRCCRSCSGTGRASAGC